MNPTQLKSLRDAIDAHLRGEPVQSISTVVANPPWIDEPRPNFQRPDREWRPKPPELIKRWAAVTSAGRMTNSWTEKGLAESDARAIGGYLIELVESSRQSFTKEPRKVYMVVSPSELVRPFFSTNRSEAAAVAETASPMRHVIEFVEVL